MFNIFTKRLSTRDHDLIRRVNHLEHYVEDVEHKLQLTNNKLDTEISNIYEAIETQGANGKIMLACLTLGGIIGLSFGTHCPQRSSEKPLPTH